MSKDALPVETYYRNGHFLREKHRLAGAAFVNWVLNLFPTWANRRVLDAGGGWGRFTWPLIDGHLIEPQNIILTDLSIGMLQTAVEEGANRHLRLKCVSCDIQMLPFPDEHFDIIMSNHVLYHLPDMERGVGELARTLRPDGCLIATTNSDKIVATVVALHHLALDELGISYVPEDDSPFSMENGDIHLRQHFRQVERHYFEDEKLIYNAGDIRATYETIGRYRMVLARDDVSEEKKRRLPHLVEELADEIIRREGVLRSPILMGTFICGEPL